LRLSLPLYGGPRSFASQRQPGLTSSANKRKGHTNKAAGTRSGSFVLISAGKNLLFNADISKMRGFKRYLAPEATPAG
jgi:hypothetical protein